MTRYEFIVNPKSGSGRRKASIEIIESTFKGLGLPYKIWITKNPGHATELAKKLSLEKDIVVCAVGGDGSLNEVARGLIGSHVPMGVIPEGSGNGLARHLKIPLTTQRAIEVLIQGHTTQIDAGELNKDPFIVTAGIGFDAEVSYNFSQRTTRGLVGYVKESIKLFPTYRSKKYRITANGVSKEREAFTISVANGSQYGNDAVIAKDASVTDGLLDLCVIKKYPKVFGPQIGISMFMKNLHNSKFYRGLQSEHIIIESMNGEKECHAQVDGESISASFPVEIKVMPGALKVIVPERVI